MSLGGTNIPDSKYVTAGSILVAFGALGIIHFDTFLSIVNIWMYSDTFVHGFTIAPISAFLIFRNRSNLAATELRPSLVGVGLLIGLSVLWWLSSLVGIQFGKQLSVVAMIPAIVIAILGTKIARVIWFPLAYLVFCVPFGEFLIPYLMDITAEFTVWALNLSGIPVLKDGRFFSIPNGNFEVAKACSGIRYLLATIALGTLYSYLTYRQVRKRLVFILVSVLLPVVANGVRAYLIVLVAHLGNIEFAAGVDHVIFGWIFFGVIISLLFLIGNIFQDDALASPHSMHTASNAVGIASIEKPSKIILFALLSIGSIQTSSVFDTAFSSTLGRIGDATDGIPSNIGSWIGRSSNTTEWAPVFVGRYEKYLADYRRVQDTVNVAVIRYGEQQHEQELVNSENQVVDAILWKVVTDHEILVDTSGRRQYEVRELVAQRGRTTRLVWYWFDVNGVILTGGPQVKWHELRHKLSGKSVASSFVAISTNANSERGSAYARLTEFFDQALEPLTKCLNAPNETDICLIGSTMPNQE